MSAAPVSTVILFHTASDSTVFITETTLDLEPGAVNDI